MEPQLASVLTGADPDVPNGGRRAGRSGPATDVFADALEESSPRAAPGDPEPRHQAIGRDAPSIHEPAAGEPSAAASQGTREIGEAGRPIAAQTEVPESRSQPVRLKIVVPRRGQRPISDSAAGETEGFARSEITERGGGQTQTSAARHEGEDVEEVTSKNTEDAEESRGVEVKCPEMFGEEQAEPLDLSFPKRRETPGRRCGRLLEDSGYESSLIMEVDEYEGEGDRDVVEEDDGGDDRDAAGLPSPPPYPAPAFASPSPTDGDAGDVLLIDDRGIPYTLGPDGLRVPQVDASTAGHPRSDQENPAGAEGRGSPRLADPSLGRSLGSSRDAPPGDPRPPPAPATDHPSPGETQDVFPKSDPPEAAEPSVQSLPADAVLSPPSGASPPSRPVPVLAKSAANTPVVLLPPPSSPSLPMGLALPLSLARSAPGVSAPMFLLLSSVASSSGAAASAPAAVAVFDPSTGRLSQIAAASTPVCLPLTSGLSGATLSHPVVRLGPGNAPALLPGASDASSGSVLTALTARPSSPARRRSQISSSDSNSGGEAIPAGEVLKEDSKPSTPAAPPPRRQSASLTCDPFSRPSSEAPSPDPGARYDPPHPQTQHLPLDDHPYFSNPAAPRSPPSDTALPSGELDPLDALDPPDAPSSAAASPNAANPRRVLYCQLCPRVFFYLSDLERHAITHSQKKPHVCHQCGKAFKRSSHLQRHKHIHTGQRNFVCPICAKRFREAGELQRHQRVHTGEKPYQCQLCHTRFAERNTLRRHTKRKHPYHQVAIEMLSERRGGGGGGGGGRRDEGGGGGGSGVREEEEEEEEGEESAEWYSSTVSHMDNSESEVET